MGTAGRTDRQAENHVGTQTPRTIPGPRLKETGWREGAQGRGERGSGGPGRPPPSPAAPCPHLQVPVVVLAQQLQEAEDGLHDGDHRAHLHVVLGLVRRGLAALPGLVVVVGVGLPPEGGEGLPGGSGSLQELVTGLFRYLGRGLFGWKANTRPSSPREPRACQSPAKGDARKCTSLYSLGDPHGWHSLLSVLQEAGAFSRSLGRVKTGAGPASSLLAVPLVRARCV